ncbi:MAG: inositol 2-dehydrogenase [Christensenellales bacterium]|jgi:myo-inositol 2-dehydrogenase/D-chiro-inositol 1-dehydrogenase
MEREDLLRAADAFLHEVTEKRGQPEEMSERGGTMKKIKTVAVIGTGRTGRLHSENILNSFRDVHIKYILDPYLSEDAAAWATGWGVEHIGTSVDPAFDDPEVDCVLICSPTPTHPDYIIRAAKAGKDIFCEKPIDQDITKIREVIEVVERSGVKFMVAFVRRFDHNHAKIRRVVQSGQLGKPEVVTIISRDPAPPTEEYIQHSGGLFFDMMIHDFDMARYVTGSEVVEVYTEGSILIDDVFAKYGDVDTAVVTLKFANGTLGQITNSRRTAYGYDQRVEVFCEKGCIQDFNNTPDNTAISAEQGVLREKPLYFMFERYNGAFAAELRHFFDAVDKGEAPSVGLHDGLQASLIALAARTSLEQHRPIRIADLGV